jgi:DNA-binding NarL/FixJ family response regulator
MTNSDLPEQSEPKPRKFLVVDDHEVVLNGTIDLLRRKYPEAEIFTAKTGRDTVETVQRVQPNLVILDLAIPESLERTTDPTSETGIQLLKHLMKDYSDLNIMVQSSHVKTLIRIKHEIDLHRGGFTIVDKSLSGPEMLERVDWALQGLTHTKDLQARVELKPEWMDVLVLAFQEGLQDQAIAQRMRVSYRTVRHYWTKLYDALGIYPEEGKNIRIQTEKRAREAGLID